MSALLKSISKPQNRTTTANGAGAFKSTNSALLDLFGSVGAFRNAPETTVLTKFSNAWAEDPAVALKILCWVRDIRGGQGERKVFRTILNWLATQAPTTVAKNLWNFVEFGRWDDLFVLKGTAVWSVVKTALKDEFESTEPGRLFWKWMPSINTSCKNTVSLAREFATAFGVTPREYRKRLSKERAAIKVLETTLCNKEWSAVDYEKVPSVANLKYRKAFSRNDATRYVNFLEAVKKGEKKINAATLYPYDIVEKALVFSYSSANGTESKTLDTLWNALPNYMKEDSGNSLVVADVSGSMSGRPMAVSISLAMYMAERNTGIFKDHFITFSAKPTLQKVKGADLITKVKNLEKAAWDMNTDLQAVFNLILNHAQAGNLPEAEMPRRLYIVSDMEFDACTHNTGATALESVRAKYALAGYQLPEVVFWNVKSSGKQSPIKVDDRGVCLVSGCSPSILTSLLKKEIVGPMDVLLNTVNVPRYDSVSI